MIKKIGSFEAKTHFADLIRKAAKGEEFLVTKNGIPMARIVPPKESDAEEFNSLVEEVIELLKVNRKGSQKEIQGLIDEGRKH